ncbi:unnamed protein product [Amoebophrya sp. A25]|nr:unnamed protein product [Amoebophrya sp. A25]|eukprot:GSA25T00017673001.1
MPGWSPLVLVWRDFHCSRYAVEDLASAFANSCSVGSATLSALSSGNTAVHMQDDHDVDDTWLVFVCCNCVRTASYAQAMTLW